MIKEPAKTKSKTVAKNAEKRRRRELEGGFNGLTDIRNERIRKVRDLADVFLEDYRIRQPKSATFAEYAICHVSRLLGAAMAVDLTDKTIVKYQTDGLKEGELHVGRRAPYHSRHIQANKGGILARTVFGQGGRRTRRQWCQRG